MARLLLLGAPGSGKGTQGVRLAERYGVVHVSSGDLLRRHIDDGTELGRRITAYVRRGDLVPDDLILAIIGEAVRNAAATGGYVLDGFPRSLSQAERAYDVARVAGETADAVVFLAVPDDVVRERLAARAAEGRADDADRDVIERRLAIFHAETRPLLDYYEGRGILVTVDAAQPLEKVTDDIAAALAARGVD